MRLVFHAERGACTDEGALREAIASELHADPFGEPARYRLVAVVHREGRLRAHIELRDEHDTKIGARDLDGRDCDELVPAMAWVIALAVEPLLRAPPPPPPTPSPPAAEPTPPPLPQPVVPPPALEVAPRPVVPSRRFAVRIGAGVAAAIDAGPTATAAFSLIGAVLRPRYSLGLEVRADLPGGGATLFDGAVSTTQSMALFVPCFRHGVASVCALGALGFEHGAGSGYTHPQSATALYAALGGRIAVDVPVLQRLLYLRVYADFLAALTRLELYVGQTIASDHRIYRTPALSSAIGTALLIEIP